MDKQSGESKEEEEMDERLSEYRMEELVPKQVDEDANLNRARLLTYKGGVVRTNCL